MPLPCPPCFSVRRMRVVMLVLVVAVMAGTVLNVFIPRGQTPHSNWTYAPTVPLLSIGSDLNIFVVASRAIYLGENPLHANYNSPPFTAVAFWPFVLMPDLIAYRVQFYLTIIENGLIFLLLAPLAGRVLRSGTESLEGVALVGTGLAAVAALHFFGYPLEFSLERGNYDSLALLAMCAGVWWAIKPGAKVWGPVLLLSLATHLKVYPALLLVIPLWQHRWRAVFPILLINGVLLCWFGFDRAIEFLQGLYVYSRNPYLWMGNHSAASFCAMVVDPLLSARLGHGATVVARLLAYGLPLALWLHGMGRLIRRGFDARNATLAFALSVPLMCLLPSVSNDYRLVITVLPALVCIFAWGERHIRDGGVGSLIALIATLACLILITRSVLFPPLLFTANKYPFVLILLALTYGLTGQGALRAEASVKPSPAQSEALDQPSGS